MIWSDPTNQRGMRWIVVLLTSNTFVQCLLSTKRVKIVCPCERCVFFCWHWSCNEDPTKGVMVWCGVSFFFFWNCVHIYSSCCVERFIIFFASISTRCDLHTLSNNSKAFLFCVLHLFGVLRYSVLKTWIGVWDEIFVIFVISLFTFYYFGEDEIHRHVVTVPGRSQKVLS